MSNNESGDDETAETAANHENDKAVSHESKDEPRWQCIGHLEELNKWVACNDGHIKGVDNKGVAGIDEHIKEIDNDKLLATQQMSVNEAWLKDFWFGEEEMKAINDELQQLHDR